jgi:hypothetical protein
MPPHFTDGTTDIQRGEKISGKVVQARVEQRIMGWGWEEAGWHGVEACQCNGRSPMLDEEIEGSASKGVPQ